MGVQKTKQKKRTGSLYGILTRKSWRYNKERKKGLGWAAELWEMSGNTQEKPRDGERYVRSLVPVAPPAPPSNTSPSQNVLCLASCLHFPQCRSLGELTIHGYTEFLCGCWESGLRPYC